MTTTLLIAFLGGTLPVLLWLWFWLREDSRCPEPRALIALVFISGGISIAVALPLEQYAHGFLAGVPLLIAWSIIEETVKFVAAYIVALRSRAHDEPIDGIIYMITAALGFAAVENSLFLLQSLDGGSIVNTILTGNFRFIGATLLHVLASATVGAAFALSFYKTRTTRFFAVCIGLILAIILHVIFNFLILYSDGIAILLVFALVWIGIIGLLLIFEKAKRLKRRHASLTHTRHGKR